MKIAFLLVLLLVASAAAGWTPGTYKQGLLATNIISLGAGRDTAYACLIYKEMLYCTGPSSQPHPSTPSGVSTDFFLLRADLKNLALDPRFGVNGYITIDFNQTVGTRTDVATSIALQRDRIVVGGESVVAVTNTTTKIFFSLTRHFASNGMLDSSFGNGGKVVVVQEDAGANQEIFGLQANDQTIVAVGFINPGAIVGAGPAFDCGVRKFHFNGSLDTSYGKGGLALIDAQLQDERCRNIHFMDQTGKYGGVFVSGRTKNVNVTEFSLFTSRLTADGQLDFSYTDGDRNLANGFNERVQGPGILTNYLWGNYEVISQVPIYEREKLVGAYIIGSNNAAVDGLTRMNGTVRQSGLFITKVSTLTGRVDTTWQNGGIYAEYPLTGTFDLQSATIVGSKLVGCGAYRPNGPATTTGEVRPFVVVVGINDKYHYSEILPLPAGKKGFCRQVNTMNPNTFTLAGEAWEVGVATSDVLLMKYVIS